MNADNRLQFQNLKIITQIYKIINITDLLKCNKSQSDAESYYLYR